MKNCIFCQSELTTVDVDGICISCKNAGFDIKIPHVVNTENLIPSTIGWICPRCQVVHSPYKYSCDCLPPSITTDSIQLDIKFNE
jgi:hypothetical protein